LPENPASYRVVRTKSYLFNKAPLIANFDASKMSSFGKLMFLAYRKISPKIAGAVGNFGLHSLP
jgi:hypothetical protein